ncbi:MAG: hypothetical protein SGJ04_09140 [Bacteroidota bacterium]|nr:hypothetical protein [Bacteroidota bacterium]
MKDTPDLHINGLRILIPNAGFKIGFSFALLLFSIFFVLWASTVWYPDAGYGSLFIAVLIPNVIFATFLRIMLTQSAIKVSLTATKEGIEEQPAPDADKRLLKMNKTTGARFIAWENVEKIQEKGDKGRDGARVLTIFIKGSKQFIQLSSRNTDIHQYHAFVSGMAGHLK